LNNPVQRVKIPENMTVSEAYKALRANIQFCAQSKNIKTIAVTSYSPNEGKTTTSINLAVSMAQIGMTVLFVDADLRKPMLFKEIGSEDFNFNGLSNILMKQTGFSEAVRETNVNGLYTVTCGIKPSNPAELISSKELSEFLQQVKQQYDIIIIDTPPLGSVIDSAVIAAQTDGVLIVVASNKVRCQNVQRVKEQLEKAGACILGVVLNKVNKSDYKYYYGGYDYYGKNKNSSRKWLNMIKNTRGNKHG
jgi:protein-tyrosine kinase